MLIYVYTYFVLHDFYRLLQDGGISWGQVEQDLPFTSETPWSRNLQMLEQIRWHSHALWNFAGHTIVLPIQVPAGSCVVKAVVDKNAILRCYMILTCFYASGLETIRVKWHILKVLRNGLLRYILNTCPNL